MRKLLPLIVVTYLFIASAIILTSKAQLIQNCRKIQSCSVSTGTNSNGNTQCTINRTIEACDGSQPGGIEACTNIGCVTSCDCTCQGTSPNFTATATSWFDDCEDIVKSNIRQCSGCPTPTTEEECEQAELFWNFSNDTCNTTPQECPGFCEEAGGIDLDLCHYEFGCPVGFSGGGLRSEQCCFPPPPCPVLIDVDGNGFRLTNATNGVNFDIDGDGDLDPVSWTSGSSTNAWLVLDRNGNGVIDNGTELFGNVSPQTVPRGAETNGFLALAEYDKPAKGGNGDGRVSSLDWIFSSLRLWQDQNHNGISESDELHSLGAWGVSAFELDYKQSKRTDDEGNQFRYRTKVKNDEGQQLGRWAWDVFLLRR